MVPKWRHGGGARRVPSDICDGAAGRWRARPVGLRLEGRKVNGRQYGRVARKARWCARFVAVFFVAPPHKVRVIRRGRWRCGARGRVAVSGGFPPSTLFEGVMSK